MLHNASKIHGYAIEASDGRLGTVSDFLFDDASWLIRWLVVDACELIAKSEYGTDEGAYREPIVETP